MVNGNGEWSTVNFECSRHCEARSNLLHNQVDIVGYGLLRQAAQGSQ